MSPPAPEPVPPPRYLTAPRVMDAMASFGRGRINELTLARAFVLAVLAGGFITAGALFATLLSTGVEPSGIHRLVQGIAFSSGFFFVVLSEAVLFTEANVVLPTTLLDEQGTWPRVARFWVVAWVGNLVGASLFGSLVGLAQTYPAEVLGTLDQIIAHKMELAAAGGAASWGRIVLSGVLANWLVGMAAFFAFMGRTIIGRYIPVLLAVSLFVAAGFQHSPANMGFFSLHIAYGLGSDWLTALGWNIVPAGIGNMIGAAGLVSVPYWFVFHRPPRQP